MTNEKYAFVEDVRNRRAMSHGSYHKKSGARSRSCKLSQDYMTAAELKRRNGPMISVRMNEPMSYATLKALSPSLAFDYLANLIREYDADGNDLAEMLGVNYHTFYSLSRRLPGKLPFKRGGHKSTNAKWDAFIAGDELVEALTEPEPVVEEAPEPTPEEAPKPEPTCIIPNGTLRIEGSPMDIGTTLASLLGNSKYTFNISFTAAL